jgi:type II secretory pathway pseudopilin PulG
MRKQPGSRSTPDITMQPLRIRSGARSASAFTLVEVVVSIGIMALVFCSVILTYLQASYRAEWSGYSLAAQSLSLQQLEQARAGVWDYSISKNELTNLSLTGWAYNVATKTVSGYTWTTLDLPVSGTNTVAATNYVTVKMLYVNNQAVPPIQMQMVTVDTVWPFTMFGRQRLYTNRTANYYGPDNRDASSL